MYNTNQHSRYILNYHLVIVTKYRHQVLKYKPLQTRLLEITKDLFEDKWGLSILEINTDKDHIHILFSSKPQVQLSKLINNYKTVSSRLLRKEFSVFLKDYYWKPYFWSPSYYIGSVSDTTTEIVSHYIQNQGKVKQK